MKAEAAARKTAEPMEIPVNIHAGVGAGRKRHPWEIRKWLDFQGLNIADIARAAETCHPTASRTIKGIANNRAVLTVLQDLGCPLEYLSLPTDMHSQSELPRPSLSLLR